MKRQEPYACCDIGNSLRRGAAHRVFERHEIWEQDGDTVLVYQIFRNILTNRYRVQQVDTLYRAADLKSLQDQLTSQKHIAIDVFMDNVPSGELAQHTTISEAIAAFWEDKE